MPHDVPGQVHWHEPAGGKKAGYGKFGRPALPYDKFMEAEGIPVYRDIGVSKVQNLPLAPWQRMGGRGSFIQLFGTEGKWGCYVVEVPARGALNPEQHLYEEIFYVVEGRGSTEVWHEGDKKRHMFEWQQGSLFSIPLNAMHRIVNATSSPGAAARRHDRAQRDEPHQQPGGDLRLPVAVPRPVQRRRRFLQAQRRYRARPGARPRHAPHQLHPGHRALRAAARQPPLAWISAHRAVHDRQQLLSVDRPARERALFQGARAHLGGRAHLPPGTGIHLHLARACRAHAVEGRQGQPGEAG